MPDRYHHGDLRRALLAHAAELAAEGNPESITLRGLARRAGVTHSAPLHHFGSREQLLTALAIEGFTGLNKALAAHPDNIAAMGNAYVDWALRNPGHYAVMWQPRLLDESVPTLVVERQRSWDLLSTTVQAAPTSGAAVAGDADAVAAFAIVHGLASIWLSGVLALPPDPAALTALITQRLAVGGS